MASFIDHVTQGSRIFLSSLKSRIKPQKYDGNADQICHAIIQDCFNGTFFQTSTTNFSQFWTRDFGWCTHSLIKLGYTKQVHKTLRYALNRFKQYNQITTTITPSGKPFNFPTLAIDSLAWLIHAIRISKFPYYSYKKFLNTQISSTLKKVLDQTTGLIKPNVHLSSIKDLAIRKSSLYDNCMLAMLKMDLAHLKHLSNPLKKYNYSDLIKRHFWQGSFFYDDLSKQDHVAGDANLFPFVLGIIADPKMIKAAIHSIEHNHLDTPLPLKYTSSREHINWVWHELFLRNYESHAIWLHLSPLYIKLLEQHDENKAKHLKAKLTQLIELHRTYPEVLTKDGKLYSSPFYVCDRGMLWAANYLTLR